MYGIVRLNTYNCALPGYIGRYEPIIFNVFFGNLY